MCMLISRNIPLKYAKASLFETLGFLFFSFGQYSFAFKYMSISVYCSVRYTLINRHEGICHKTRWYYLLASTVL